MYLHMESQILVGGRFEAADVTFDVQFRFNMNLLVFLQVFDVVAADVAFLSRSFSMTCFDMSCEVSFGPTLFATGLT